MTGTNAKEVADMLRKLADALEQDRVEEWNVEVSANPTNVSSGRQVHYIDNGVRDFNIHIRAFVL